MKIQLSVHGLLAGLLSAAALFSSCSEAPLEPDRKEHFNREFIKNHGVFDKSHSWSEARTKTLTIKSTNPVPVKILAEVNGEEFLFASLSRINGVCPVLVNVPKTVDKLTVLRETDGRRITANVGGTVDLDLLNNSVTQSDAQNVEICNDGQKRQTIWDSRWIKAILFQGLDPYLSPEEAERYLEPGNNTLQYVQSYKNDGNKVGFFQSVRMREFQSTYVNIYPYYWRTNSYGEKDYMLGVYWREEEDDIVMMDIEDFSVNTAVEWQKSGSTKWVLASSDENVAYDFSLLKSGKINKLRSTGIRLNLTGFDAQNKGKLGFYIKSGLKETYTPGKGRDSEHITFSELRFNKEYWGKNYWDMPVDKMGFCYAGARGKGGTGYEAVNNGLEAEKTASIIGFTSMPQGSAEEDYCDFSDVIIAVRSGAAVDTGAPFSRNKSYYKYFPWYLASEDLGGSFDWDYNDLVVAIYDITTDYGGQINNGDISYPLPDDQSRRIIVRPLAAGGTMPIYLMFDGEAGTTETSHKYLSEYLNSRKKGTYVVGTELHRWLQANRHDKPLNVDGTFNHRGRAVSFSIAYNHPPFDWQKPPSELGQPDSPLHGFWVLVDKDDKLRLYEQLPTDAAADPVMADKVYVSGNSIEKEVDLTDGVLTPFNAQLGTGIYRIDSPSANPTLTAPQMILTHYSWYWPKEMVNITRAWPKFNEWVADQSVVWFSNTGSQNGLYNDEQCCISPHNEWWVE